jgi:hypothetical protein
LKKTEPRTVTFLPIRQIFKKKTDGSNISENTNKSLGIISHTETEEGSIPLGGEGGGIFFGQQVSAEINRCGLYTYNTVFSKSQDPQKYLKNTKIPPPPKKKNMANRPSDEDKVKQTSGKAGIQSRLAEQAGREAGRADR